tara:strand:- start:336 stop:509 length:174 start_codon:yes stop_codon:yes gene_type:complete
MAQDSLFSNYYQTHQPTVALFLEHETHDKCKIMLDGQNWSVELRNIKHNVMAESHAS